MLIIPQPPGWSLARVTSTGRGQAWSYCQSNLCPLKASSSSPVTTGCASVEHIKSGGRGLHQHIGEGKFLYRTSSSPARRCLPNAAGPVSAQRKPRWEQLSHGLQLRLKARAESWGHALRRQPAASSGQSWSPCLGTGIDSALERAWRTSWQQH